MRRGLRRVGNWLEMSSLRLRSGDVGVIESDAKGKGIGRPRSKVSVYIEWRRSTGSDVRAKDREPIKVYEGRWRHCTTSKQASKRLRER